MTKATKMMIADVIRSNKANATKIKLDELEYTIKVDELKEVIILVLSSEYDTLGNCFIMDLDGIYEICDESHWNEGSYSVATIQIIENKVYNETRELSLEEVTELINKIDKLINCKEV